MKTKYMMATKANHKMGDISRDEADICIIFEEQGTNYIGNWVTGFGFIGVEFPKDTTRDLTPEEFEKYQGQVIELNGTMMGAINLTNEDFRKRVTLIKENSDTIYVGQLVAPIKVGKGVSMYLDDGRPVNTSTVLSIVDDKINTKNSTYKLVYETV